MPRWPGHRKTLQWPHTREPEEKQAARNLGEDGAASQPTECPSLSQRCTHCSARLKLSSAVKGSTPEVLTPLTQHGANEIFNLGANVLLSAATTLDASAAYTPPFAAALGVQNAVPLLPGQPLPQNVAVFGLAMPAPQ